MGNLKSSLEYSPAKAVIRIFLEVLLLIPLKWLSKSDGWLTRLLVGDWFRAHGGGGGEGCLAYLCFPLWVTNEYVLNE